MPRLMPFFITLMILVQTTPAQSQRRAVARTRELVGFLKISCPIQNATVIIDGEERGITPLPRPLRMRVGKHSLKLIKRGYTEYLDVVTIRRNKITLMDVDLLPYAGIFTITSNTEDSRVFIDGKFVGIAPLEQEVLIGKRTVRVAKAGYYDYIGTIQSIAGRSKRIRVTLFPLPTGTSPYRPKPLPPLKWYEKWYVWAGIAAGAAAVTLAVVLPISLNSKDKIEEFNPEYRWPTNQTP